MPWSGSNLFLVTFFTCVFFLKLDLRKNTFRLYEIALPVQIPRAFTGLK